MATRFTVKPGTTFGVASLPTGFNNVSVPDNLVIPPCGIEDVDVALFNLFNEEMTLSVIEKEGIKKVPVIFASGEKWAMLKRGRALRDKQDTLILPLITIGRANIQQLTNEDIAGRGINQQTGELIIKRRLDKSDRQYQSLINKILLKNQQNASGNPNDELVLNQLTTDRKIGELSLDPTFSEGGSLASNRLNNVWEIITIPAPQFFTAIYEVTIWVQYTSHMNQVLEGLISSFLPQGNCWRLETKKGYWFIANVDGNLFSAENNADDMSSEERIIKYKFNVKVPAYILASKTPGAPVPLRRYVSNPDVQFAIGVGNDPNVCGSMIDSDVVDEPFLGADDPTLPTSLDSNRHPDQRNRGQTRLYSGKGLNSSDPALRKLPRGMKPSQYRAIRSVGPDGKERIQFRKIKRINPFTGETVYACLDIPYRNFEKVPNPEGEGFLVVDLAGNYIVDIDGNLVIFLE